MESYHFFISFLMHCLSASQFLSSGLSPGPFLTITLESDYNISKVQLKGGVGPKSPPQGWSWEFSDSSDSDRGERQKSCYRHPTDSVHSPATCRKIQLQHLKANLYFVAHNNNLYMQVLGNYINTWLLNFFRAHLSCSTEAQKVSL